MVSLITTSLRVLWSKAGLYVLAAISFAIAAARIVSQIKSGARATERLKHTETRLKEQRRAKRVEAEIDALNDAERRKRLRQRWGKR